MTTAELKADTHTTSSELAKHLNAARQAAWEHKCSTRILANALYEVQYDTGLPKDNAAWKAAEASADTAYRIYNELRGVSL